MKVRWSAFCHFSETNLVKQGCVFQCCVSVTVPATQVLNKLELVSLPELLQRAVKQYPLKRKKKSQMSYLRGRLCPYVYCTQWKSVGTPFLQSQKRCLLLHPVSNPKIEMCRSSVLVLFILLNYFWLPKPPFSQYQTILETASSANCTSLRRHILNINFPVEYL